MTTPERPVRRPNILHLLSDQHSPHVAGCYGDPVVQTPHLDRIAANGVVFDAAYCPSPICVPSRASMLTARHPYQNECWNNSHILDSGIPTFAHALGAAGYRTCLVGRMHSLGPDQLRGYQERYIGDHSPNFEGGGTPARGLLDGTAGPSRVSLSNSGPGQGGYQVHDEYVTAAAVDWLNRHAIQRHSLSSRTTDGSAAASIRPEHVEGPGDQPFLLSVGFMLPHQPFVARLDEYERYRGRVPAPKHSQPSQPEHPYLRWWRERAGIESVTGEELERTRTAYWALVDRLDALIGQVLRALEENGLAENTLILYTTDHGEQAGEHGLWWKQTMYEASARVPLLLSWPGVIPAGQRCSRVVSALDATATILDAAGAPALPDMRGRSLLGLVGADEARLTKAESGPRATAAGSRTTAPAPAGPRRPSEPLPIISRPLSADWEDVAFSEFCVEEGWFHRMVRSGPWKLVYYHGYRPQLFNLEDDPGEERDLAEDPTHASVRAELTARVLDGWDPERISATWQLKKQQSQVLRSWARATHPDDQYRWDMPPDVNYLDLDPVPIG